MPRSATTASAKAALASHALDLSALIGLLMLRSIVVTNATVLLDFAVVTTVIVLRDFVLHEIEAGADVRTALVQSGRTRLRSILKTAVPGRGGASTSLVMIGGLLSSTLLALVVIPVIDNLVVELCRGGAGGGDLLTPPRSPAR